MQEGSGGFDLKRNRLTGRLLVAEMHFSNGPAGRDHVQRRADGGDDGDDADLLDTRGNGATQSAC